MKTIGTVVVAALAANAGATRSQWSAKVSRVELRSIPTTGIAGCCARATRGHAAIAPPSSVMNARRLMLISLFR